MACMNIIKLLLNNRYVYRNFYKQVTIRKSRFIVYPILRLYQPFQILPSIKNTPISTKTPVFTITLSLLTWLGFTKDDEEKESELIMTLKRAVLCMKREQYEKAEQMLHLALRLAQQQQNEQGVLYCYDLMANLAMDTIQLDKAEKLFVSVMQMLLSSGTNQDDLKMIHISLKMAKIAQLKADLDRANLGYNWCLDQIKKYNFNENIDAKMLYGIIHDWYAQFLLDKGDVKQAVEHLKTAYDICQETKGKATEQSMLLLNDLATASFRIDDLKNSLNFLKEAIEIGENLDDQIYLGVVYANYGLILLESGMGQEAQKYCQQAWKLGKKYENNETIQQADYCFDQIKMKLGQ